MRSDSERIPGWINSRLLLHAAIIVFTLFVALVSVRLVAVVTDVVRSSTLTFDRDEVQHAIDGWEVYRAVTGHDLRGVVDAILKQSYYPPVHSLFVALWYVIGEPDLVYSRLPSIANLVLLLAALAFGTYWAVWKESRQTGQPGRWLALLGSMAAVSFAVTSHALVTNAALCMLEITGALLAVLFFIYVDNGEDKQTNLWLVGAALLGWVVFLEKYSFGLYLVLGLAAALVTRRVSLSNFPWRDWVKSAVMGLSFFALVFLWISTVNKPSMYRFFSLHQSLVDTSETSRLFFYLKAWLDELSITPLAGLLSFVLFMVGVVSHWKKLSVRTSFWAVLIALVVVSILPNNDSRHFLIVAPLVWLVAGIGFVWIIGRVRESSLRNGLSVLLLVVFTAAVFVNIRGYTAGLSADIVKLFETKPYHGQMQEFILENIDLESPILMIGDLKDTNSLLNFRWRAALLTDKSLWDLTIDQYPFNSREDLLIMTNRKLQVTPDKPFHLDSTLPEVLDSGYYTYLVNIISVNDDTFQSSDQLYPGLSSKEVDQAEFSGHRVIIYQLQ